VSARRWEIVCWSATGLFVLAAVIGARGAAVNGPDGESDALPAPERAITRSDTGAAVITPVIANDPFRLVRHPSPIAYRPELEGVAPPPPPPKPPHPVLTLSGILGGPPWQAMLEGVPGHDASTLVNVGDVLGVLRVQRITADSIVIVGEDTTWRLGVKRAWP